VEITEARYIDQLETLPPVDWCRGYGGESFKSMEFTGGDVTAIFVGTARVSLSAMTCTPAITGS
jgi:hypothetical protein